MPVNFTPQLDTFTLVGNTASSDMTASLVTQFMDIRGLPGCSIQAVYTGSPTGTLSIEATNSNPSKGAVTWVEVADSSTDITAEGSYFWNLKTAYYAFVRLKYVFTSGSGTLTVFAAAKEG